MSAPSSRSWDSVVSAFGEGIVYTIVGLIIGCSFVVGTYLLSRSIIFSLILFFVIALPLYFGGQAYLIVKLKRAGSQKGSSDRLILLVATRFGFCVLTLPVLS